ncbi:MAG: RluA family pseudouridine synthase [Parvibaculaceae bacterium]
MPGNPLERRFLVPPEADGERLDRALAQAFDDVSRSRFQDLIAEGRVAVDGRTIVEARARVKQGMAVAFTLPPPVAAEPRPETIPLSILFEDDDLIVIDKPAGLVVHPAAGNQTGTLVNALIAHCGESLSGIGGVKRPGIVHRLDKDTSGVLVVAKTDLAHKGLSRQFAAHGRDGRLERAYTALAWGALPARSGAIDAPLGRSSANRTKIAVRPDGRPAVTRYEVRETFPAGGAPKVSLLACVLETGRTHQIRVHLAHIGHPLLGDATYGSGFKASGRTLPLDAREALEALGRQALHARMLGFEHPRTRRKMRFEAPLPQDFSNLLNALGLWERDVNKD